MGCAIGGLADGTDVSLSDLAGDAVVVDGHLDLHQYLTAITDDWNDYVRNEEGDPISHLIGLGSRVAPVIGAGIRPIYVFDGGYPDLKEEEVESRRDPEAEEEFWAAKEAGEKDRARKLAYKKVAVTDEMIDGATELLNAMGVPVYSAPGEGEPQCAQFVHEGEADHVVTDDWDAFLYDVPTVVRNWGASGASLVERDQILAENDWTIEELRWYAVLRGTDYNSSVSGVGPVRGQDIVSEADCFDDVIEAAESWGEVDRERWRETLRVIEKPRVEACLNPEWSEPDPDLLEFVACDRYGVGESQVETWIDQLGVTSPS